MIATLIPRAELPAEVTHLHVDALLERIRSGASKAQIEKLRTLEGKQVQSNYKLKNLPMACFSGTFSYKNAESLIKHSGLVNLDWDGIKPEDMFDLTEAVRAEKFIYATWISPRGGLKALAKIANPEKHREHYAALMDYFGPITGKWGKPDPLNIDIGRGCYESYDPNIWVNREATAFTHYLIEEKIFVPTYEGKTELIPKILKWCASKGKAFVNGERNAFVLSFAGACCRFGIHEQDVMAFCNYEFVTANSTDFGKSESDRTIKNAYRFWKNQYNTAEFKSGQLVDIKTRGEISVEPPKEFLDMAIPPKDVVYADDVWEKAKAYFDNGYQQLDGIGVKMFDDLFKLKRGELTVLTGYGNHGKSSIMKYTLLCHAILYDRKFAIFPPEDNPAEQFYNDLVEILLGCDITPRPDRKISHELYEKAYRWVGKHFFYIYPETESPTPTYIKHKFLELVIKEGVDGVVIDPWNQLDHDMTANGFKGREDLYLSMVLGDFARFATANNLFFWILAHPKSAGKKVKDNYPCPDVYDLAGGAMWNNKAWNVLVYHRPLFYSTPDDPMCELHAKKIKRREVGKRGFIEMEYKPRIRRFIFDGVDPMDSLLSKLNITGLYEPKPITQPLFVPPEPSVLETRNSDAFLTGFESQYTSKREMEYSIEPNPEETGF